MSEVSDTIKSMLSRQLRSYSPWDNCFMQIKKYNSDMLIHDLCNLLVPGLDLVHDHMPSKSFFCHIHQPRTHWFDGLFWCRFLLVRPEAGLRWGWYYKRHCKNLLCVHASMCMHAYANMSVCSSRELRETCQNHSPHLRYSFLEGWMKAPFAPSIMAWAHKYVGFGTKGLLGGY